jgi:hypothetical protein
MATLEQVSGLVRDADYLAVVAVARGDGTVHASVVKAGVLPDPADGQPSVGMVVTGQARKLAFLRAAAQATVVFQDGFRWASVEGTVRLHGPDDPDTGGSRRPLAQVIRDIYAAAGGTHDDWAEFDRVMAEDRRSAVFVRPTRIQGVG